MRVLDQICLPGSSYKDNEDSFGAVFCEAGALAWVIDGATSGPKVDLFGTGISPVAWFSRQLTKRLQEVFAQATTYDLPLKEGLTKALKLVQEDFQASLKTPPQNRGEEPAAVFSCVRVLPNKMEIAWLGDCDVVLLPERGAAKHFGGEATMAADEEWIVDIATKIRRQHADKPIEEAEKFCWAELDKIVGHEDSTRKNDPTVERPAYYLSPTEQVAVDHIQVREHLLFSGHMLLLTDGLSTIYEELAQAGKAAPYATPTKLVEALRDGTQLDQVAKIVRQIETQDNRCLDFPRFKKSDDLTGLWVEV